MFDLTSHDIDVFFRLLAATGLGALVGLEREFNGKEAGFKTYTLVCLGSALMMIVSADIYLIYKGLTIVDPSRIAAQVVTGIGFLGAGAIIRDQQGVRGLTTAAGIWAVCGIGLACGTGLFKPAIFTTALVLVVLVLFQKVEHKMIPKKKHEKNEE
ncbi:MAG TPA: MgtC/SapB family protein [Candidatus Omnitrophota bacterium]|nr:MgtC/SapB family protein [Candidatus Omnitrophota bacterium]HPS37107.1 MgtC/SapB family protein [Candidatus Omnitrophota bacterium]